MAHYTSNRSSTSFSIFQRSMAAKRNSAALPYKSSTSTFFNSHDLSLNHYFLNLQQSPPLKWRSEPLMETLRIIVKRVRCPFDQ
jgi:hypothetical protein